jgi:putative hydrolases of HD superfamily
MKRMAELLYEACFLKHLPRSGYSYLGAGKESVAEHVYSTMFIAFVLSQLEPKADAHRLITMCLLHDLPEARTGDLNYVQKNYVTTDNEQAMADAFKDLPFGDEIKNMITEFEAGETLEACLARDADQLSLIIDLKSLKDVGNQTPQTWLPHVQKRLKTTLGRQLAQAILNEEWDGWWRKLFC